MVNKSIFPHRLRVSLALFAFWLWRHSRMPSAFWNAADVTQDVKIDILFVEYRFTLDDIHRLSCRI